MAAPLRLVCLTALLMGGIASSVAAAPGRGDHDTPATQRQSDPPQRYDARACRTDENGWFVCRDGSGQWRREEAQRRYWGNARSDGVDNWFWRLLH
jgi:hypothetical protein